MALLSRMADRLILCPSTDFIDPEDRQRQLIAVPDGHVEAWVTKTTSRVDHPKRLVAIKFPGAGGRAERGGPHPCDVWPDVDAEIWTINNTGYGGSSGVATVQTFESTATRVYQHVAEKFSDRPVLLVGNSLGCVSALFLAANFRVNGLYLRNPPPLHQMISTRPRYNWWNFGLAKMIARQVPATLNAVTNASKTKTNCLFVQSQGDRVIPCVYQDLIIAAYAGPKRVFTIQNADHHHTIPDRQYDEYVAALAWLESCL